MEVATPRFGHGREGSKIPITHRQNMQKVHMATAAEIQGEPGDALTSQDEQIVDQPPLRPLVQTYLRHNDPPASRMRHFLCNNFTEARQQDWGFSFVATRAPSYRRYRSRHKQLKSTTHYRLKMLVVLLASKINKALQHTAINYASDSQVLVSTLQRQDFLLYPGDWRLRPQLYEFTTNNTCIHYTLTKISREHNRTAHALTQKAITATNVTTCTFSYNHLAHPEQCLILETLQNVFWVL